MAEGEEVERNWAREGEIKQLENNVSWQGWLLYFSWLHKWMKEAKAK